MCRSPSAVPRKAARAEVNAWVVIKPDDTVIIRIARSEMGQGTLTGLAQLVAEELECDWSKVTTEYPTPGQNLARNRVWGNFSTGGSRGIRESHEYVRKGGATAREMLIAAAAAEWKVPATRMFRGQQRDHAQAEQSQSLVSAKWRPPLRKSRRPKDVALKDPKNWKIAGKPLARLDTADKLTGKQIYGTDLKLPGMLNATVRACPYFGGKVKSFDASAVAKMPGVRKVVQIDDTTLAVVADTWWQAKTAMDALPIVWDEGPNKNVSSESIARDAQGRSRRQRRIRSDDGRRCAGARLAAAKKTISAVYAYPVSEPRHDGADERDGALHAAEMRSVGADAKRRGESGGGCGSRGPAGAAVRSLQAASGRRLRPARQCRITCARRC